MLRKLIWLGLIIWFYWQSDLTSTNVFAGVIAPLGFFFATVFFIFGSIMSFATRGRTGQGGGVMIDGNSTAHGGCRNDSSADYGGDGGGGDGNC